METLLDLLSTISRLRGLEAMRWSDGYRTHVVSYTELYRMAGKVARYLDQRAIGKGDRVMIWSENRPEWLAVFWACIARGIEVVPVDFRFSIELVTRIYLESQARLIVHGAEVHADGIGGETLPLRRIAEMPEFDGFSVHAVSRDDVVEVVYTSGTTGEPRGVIHRHRNICANLAPFKTEIEKYRKWATPLQPIRILNLLPLSHMFGQSMGLYLPALLQGSVSFMNDLNSGTIILTIRKNRISVAAAVPRILENLRSEVERRFRLPEPPAGKGWSGLARKWWRYRRVHRLFGWKFWAFVVGGARLDPELEEFWAGLGFAVIQGYGLTETSPVVAVNHPFNARRGSLGKVVEGQDVRIAPDGEILVRGESVITDGEWLHTGDLGELDNEGRLYYRGRKKDLIVTPEGLNVHPEDVEKALSRFPEIRDSAVVAVNEHVHAALIMNGPALNPEAIDAVVRRANEQLEAHQRIRGWSVWPAEDFPRTASTFKVKRNEVAAALAALAARGRSPKAENRRTNPQDLMNVSGGFVHFCHGQPGQSAEPASSPAMGGRWEDLSALSSLERVELLADLENRFGAALDESSFSKLTTSAELDAWLAMAKPAQPDIPVSNWPQKRLSRWIRAAFQGTVMLPIFHNYMELTVDGVENLAALEPPVIFAANHTSHLDTIAVAAALPRRWRKLLAPAMMQEYFHPHFEPEHFSQKDIWRARVQYVLARGLLNTYPLPQQMAGVRRALQYTGELVSQGFCPLVYPEGTRTPDDSLGRFKPGIGMMAVRLGVPVVPIRIAGLFQIYSIHHTWPSRGAVHVKLGKPIKFSNDGDYAEAAGEIEAVIRSM